MMFNLDSFVRLNIHVMTIVPYIYVYTYYTPFSHCVKIPQKMFGKTSLGGLLPLGN